MAKPKISVTVNLDRLDKYRRTVRTGGRPLNKVFTKWQKRYSTWLQKRYLKFSRGGGDWPPIKPATAKRKGNKLILVDTGASIKAFNPRFVGKPNRRGPLSIILNFGTRAKRKHPNSKRKTIQQILSFHQRGVGNLPVRKTIVPPPPGVQNGFVSDLRSVFNDLAKDVK